MQVISITQQGRENIVNMSSLKRNILTVLCYGEITLVKLIDALRMQYDGYRNMQIKIFAIAITELINSEYVEYTI